MRQVVAVALASLLAVGAAHAEPATPVELGFLNGEWTIFDHEGETVGTASIDVQWPDAVLFEQRRIGDQDPQPLWFVNSEEAGGWQQLFVAVNGLVRRFDPESPAGEWPLVLVSDFVLRDGTPASFRATVGRASDNESRRVLEMSTDDGATWTTVFDYTYRRKE